MSGDSETKSKKQKKPFFRKDKKKAVDEKPEKTTPGPEDGKVSKAKAKTPKRKKEKDKAKKKLAMENHIHETVGQSKALRYLENWSEERGNWKFEKCRQIWLLQNCYDLVKINDQKFDILLEYMGTIKGKMREMAIGTYVGFTIFQQSLLDIYAKRLLVFSSCTWF